jgi:hypothetical protein
VPGRYLLINEDVRAQREHLLWRGQLQMLDQESDAPRSVLAQPQCGRAETRLHDQQIDVVLLDVGISGHEF